MTEENTNRTDDLAKTDGTPAAPSATGKDSKPWLDMINGAKKVFTTWNDACDTIDKLFADLEMLANHGDSQFQMFFANMEVMKPSIYARPPQPVVVQRFKDANRPVHRKAGEMLERSLSSSFDSEKVHSTLLLVRDNLARNARGTAWLRYEADYGEDEAPEPEDGADPAQHEAGETPAAEATEETAETAGKKPTASGSPPAAAEEKAPPKECNRYEWVQRRDYLHEPARCWQEVGWVARGTWLDKEQIKKRFKDLRPEDLAKIKFEQADDTDKEYTVENKARVWELWHKGRNVVVWLHPGLDVVLDIAPPHLTLDGFFPCPKPAYGTCQPDTLIPVPDVLFYKDQLDEINLLTARISALAEGLKLMGFYPAGVEDLGVAIEAAMAEANKGENRRILMPLPGFSGFGNGGGDLKNAVVWLPIDDVAKTITQIVALRKQLIEDVYQISGISDIMRGQTEASETLGAQQLKSQYGSIRIKDRQGEMVRFCDAILNISGEIMAENFHPLTLVAMSQIDDLPRQAQIVEQANQKLLQVRKDLIEKARMAAMAAAAPPPAVEGGGAPAPAGPPPQGGATPPPGAQPQGGPGAPPVDPMAALEAEFAQIKAALEKEVNETVTLEKVIALLRGQRLRPFALMIATDSTIQPDENAEKAARNEFAGAFGQITTALAPLIQASGGKAAPFAGEMLKFVLAPYRAGRQMEQAIDDFVEQMIEQAQQPPPPSPEQIAAQAEAERTKADLAAKEMDRQAKQQEMLATAAMRQREDEYAQATHARETAAAEHQAAMDAKIAAAEHDARIREILAKADADARAREYDLAIQAGQVRLQELAIELAEVKLKQAKAPPKPAANGDGAHA